MPSKICNKKVKHLYKM